MAYGQISSARAVTGCGLAFLTAKSYILTSFCLTASFIPDLAVREMGLVASYHHPATILKINPHPYGMHLDLYGLSK